jgi:hypothetical protein
VAVNATLMLTRLRHLATLITLLVCVSGAAAKASDWEEDPQRATQRESIESKRTAEEPDAEESISRGTTLKGGIQHSDKVEPVESKYLPGETFDFATSDHIATLDNWILLPEWFVGGFEDRENILLSMTDFTNHTTTQPNQLRKIFQSYRFGHQRDSQGRPWHLISCPFVTWGMIEGLQQRVLCKTWDFLDVTDKRVVVRSTGLKLIIDPRTHRIVSAGPSEQIVKYYPHNDSVRMKASMMEFSPQGLPLSRCVTLSYSQRKDKFREDPKRDQVLSDS